MFKIIHMPTLLPVIDSEYFLEDYDCIPDHKIDSPADTTLGVIYFHTELGARKFLELFTSMRVITKVNITGLLLLSPLLNSNIEIIPKNTIEFMIVGEDYV